MTAKGEVKRREMEGREARGSTHSRKGASAPGGEKGEEKNSTCVRQVVGPAEPWASQEAMVLVS